MQSLLMITHHYKIQDTFIWLDAARDLLPNCVPSTVQDPKGQHIGGKFHQKWTEAWFAASFTARPKAIDPVSRQECVHEVGDVTTLFLRDASLVIKLAEEKKNAFQAQCKTRIALLQGL